MKKALAVFFAVVMMASLVAGCNTKQAGGGDGEVRTLGRFPLAGEIQTFIHGNHDSTQNTLPISLVYETMFMVSPQGELEGLLVESWETSEDGLTYTFKIRPNVKFHNGDVMTSEDVAWSINFNRDGAFSREIFGKYVDFAEAVDAETVVMHMLEPFAAAPVTMADRAGVVYNKKWFEEECGGDENVFSFKPMGTGSFVFEKYNTGEGVYFNRFDDYWGEKSKLERIELLIITDTNAVQTAMETDALDFAGISIGVPNTSLESFSTNPEFKLTIGGSTMCWFLPINCETFPDQKVRQAMAHAVDKDYMIEVCVNGYGEPANVHIGKKAFGFTEQEPYEFDIEKAKALLKEAGYENGVGLPEMQIVSRPDRKTGSEALQAMWAEIGVKSIVDVQEASTYLTEISLGRFGTSILSNTYAVDAAAMTRWWGDDFSGNWSRLCNYDAKALLDEAGRIVDTAKRQELYDQAFKLIRDDANYIYMFYDQKIYLHRANLVIGETYPVAPPLHWQECYWLPEGQTQS